MDKKTLRIWAKNERAKLDMEKISAALVLKLQNSAEYKNSKNIMIYYPLKYEVNLLTLLNDKTIKFYLPRIKDEELECCPYFEDDELVLVKTMHLLAIKPIIYAANVSEFDLKDGNDYVNRVKAYAKENNAEVVIISAKIEQELAELEPEEAKEYLNDLGVENSGIERMIQSVYRLLNLRTFLTAGEK